MLCLLTDAGSKVMTKVFEEYLGAMSPVVTVFTLKLHKEHWLDRVYLLAIHYWSKAPLAMDTLKVAPLMDVLV